MLATAASPLARAVAFALRIDVVAKHGTQLLLSGKHSPRK
jgi:hypothetical protein